MNGLIGSFIDNSVQCWGCPVFDRLFQIISGAAAAAYGQFVFLCMILFCILLAFFVLNAVWNNIKGGIKDPFYMNSVKPVLINSIVAFAFLGLGVAMPRFVTTITFEPVAQIALVYTQSLVQTDSDVVNEQVVYQPKPMSDDGFYRPQLRDTIIMLMKTTISQFQVYMKLGVAVMESAFSWKALLGIGALLKHVFIFFVGLYLLYGFGKIFIRFCFYFVDIIWAMTLFAFFFPISLTLFVFKGNDAPKWMSGLGKNLSQTQFKNLINSIVALASAVLTYSVIMVIIAKFFSSADSSGADLMNAILSGQVFESDLVGEDIANLTLASCIVLVYVLNFIYAQIPEVTKKVLGAFDVGEKNDMGKQLATDMQNLAGAALNTVGRIGKIIVSGGKTDDAKSGSGGTGKK